MTMCNPTTYSEWVCSNLSMTNIHHLFQTAPVIPSPLTETEGFEMPRSLTEAKVISSHIIEPPTHKVKEVADSEGETVASGSLGYFFAISWAHESLSSSSRNTRCWVGTREQWMRHNPSSRCPRTSSFNFFHGVVWMWTREKYEFMHQWSNWWSAWFKDVYILFYDENFRSLAAPPYEKLTGSYVHILLWSNWGFYIHRPKFGTIEMTWFEGWSVPPAMPVTSVGWVKRDSIQNHW